jgi:hypothetical protein
MIKKLLSIITGIFTNHPDKETRIEDYLAQSMDLLDLENRMHELDKKGVYNRFYI